MQTNPLSIHSEYQVRDMIDRLESLRCGLDHGDLRYALETAIECMEYLVGSAKTPTSIIENDATRTPPHWTISRHGFAGESYTCSTCKLTFWDLPQNRMGKCEECGTVMDLSSTVFEGEGGCYEYRG